MSASVNTAQILKQLLQVQKSIPKVTSRAMQRTTEAARDDARASAFKRLHKPRPQTIKAIRAKWPNRGQVVQGKAVAGVFIAPFMVDALYPNIVRTTETKVPKAGKGIAQPTRKLRLNKHGNIAGLRGGSVRRKRQDTAKFLDVPLNSTSTRTKHLPAGLYQIVGSGRRRHLKMILSYKKQRTITPRWTEYPTVIRKSYERNYSKFWLEGFQREVGKIKG